MSLYDRFLNVLSKVRRGLLILLVIAYFLKSLTGWPTSTAFWGFLILIILIVFSPLASHLNRIFMFFFILVGWELLNNSNVTEPWHIFLKGLQQNLPLIILILLVPLLASLARLPHYQSALKKLMAKAGSSQSRSVTTSLLIIHALAAFFNVAAIGLSYQILAPLRKSYGDVLVARSLGRGYSYCVIWSPSISAVALILTHYQIPWTLFLPVALIPTIALLFFAKLELQERESRDTLQYAQAVSSTLPRGLWELIVIVISLVTLIVIGEMLFIIKIIFLISIIALIFPPCWACATRQWEGWLREDLKPYFNNLGNRFGNELLLFISAGVLTTGLSTSGLASELLASLDGTWFISSFGAIFVILIAVAFPSLLGIHPIITVSALLPILIPGFAGYSGFFLALLLTTGWAIGTVGSPLTALNLVLQDLTGESSWVIAYKWYGYRILKDILIAGCVLIVVGLLFRV